MKGTATIRDDSQVNVSTNAGRYRYDLDTDTDRQQTTDIDRSYIHELYSIIHVCMCVEACASG